MRSNGSASRYVAAPPDDVFRLITDVSRLPEWNERMTGVVETPPELMSGSEWVVGFHIGGKRFNSRSVVVELDPGRRRFVHRSKPDDENPSHTLWMWTVEPAGSGSRVTLGWDLRPATPLRKLLAAPMRAWQIPRQDAPRSLAALAYACEAEASQRPN